MSGILKWHLGHMSVEKAWLCANCKCVSPYIEECSHTSFQMMELKRMLCPNPECPVKDWFYCSPCGKPLRSKSNLKRHAATKTHRSNESRFFLTQKNLLLRSTIATTTTVIQPNHEKPKLWTATTDSKTATHSSSTRSDPGFCI